MLILEVQITFDIFQLCDDISSPFVLSGFYDEFCVTKCQGIVNIFVARNGLVMR